MGEKVTLTKKDLNKLFIRSNAIQSAFNFERQQALGFEWAMIPVINKLYPTKEERIVISVTLTHIHGPAGQSLVSWHQWKRKWQTAMKSVKKISKP